MSDYDLGRWLINPVKAAERYRIPPAFTRLALHDDVPVATLTKALTRFGLTLSNVHGVGLVIHKAGEDASP